MDKRLGRVAFSVSYSISEVLTLVESALISAGTAFLTTIATKSGGPVAETLGLIWKITLGRWDPKMEAIVKKNTEKYAAEINEQVSKIPNEDINKDPDISIIGPAFEASKYYVNRDDARKMFAKLIAAELDVKKMDKVHHAFVDIIQQMSTNDAKMMKILPTNGPVADIRLLNKNGTAFTRILTQDIIYIPGLIEDNFVDNAVSLNNLSRLGLVEIDHVLSLTEPSSYAPYKSLLAYRQGESEIANNPDKYSRIELSKGLFSITPLGQRFKEICL